MIIKPCLNYKPLLHSSCLMNPTTQTYCHPAPHDGVSTNISLSPYSEITQGLRGLRQLGCLLASSGDLLNQDQSQLTWEMCQLLLQAPRDSLAFFCWWELPTGRALNPAGDSPDRVTCLSTSITESMNEHLRKKWKRWGKGEEHREQGVRAVTKEWAKPGKTGSGFQEKGCLG